jgi:ribosomal protein S18 acetylase RimI-like enzyme
MNNKLSDACAIEVKSKEDIILTAELAKAIWEEHYTPMIGSAQVKYMIENFQSEVAISKSIKDDCNYYIIWLDGSAVGYFAIKLNEPLGKIFLSKLYVKLDSRRKGLASMAIERIKEIAKTHDLKFIWLTVNKNNTNSIKAYEKFGLKKVKSIITPIGSGFVMDDYIMELDMNDENII